MPYHDFVSTPTVRPQRNWQTGEVFTVTDATELYEVDRWGKGYFSISPGGDVLVHPTKDPQSSINLKELTDHLMLRGIQLPVLIGCAAVFECELASHQEAGDHVLFIGRVLRATDAPLAPLVFHAGHYHMLGEIL